VQQQHRAQWQRQAGDLGAEAIQRAAEPEPAKVGIAEQRIAAQLLTDILADGGVNRLLNIEGNVGRQIIPVPACSK
jgi:hypothetical protein